MRSVKISQATCNALCGDNGRLLWPRPTGTVVLGEDSVNFHLQQVQFNIVNTSDRDVKDLLDQAKDIFLGELLHDRSRSCLKF